MVYWVGCHNFGSLPYSFDFLKTDWGLESKRSLAPCAWRLETLIYSVMRIPKPLVRLIEAFQKLPGIGPKTAQRLTYYLLHVPQTELEEFAASLENLKKETILCSVCKNVSESDPCPICNDQNRDHTQLLVVEQPLDILAFEKTGR